MSAPWPRAIDALFAWQKVLVEPGAGTLFLQLSTGRVHFEVELTVLQAQAVIEAMTEAAREATSGGAA